MGLLARLQVLALTFFNNPVRAPDTLRILPQRRKDAKQEMHSTFASLRLCGKIFRAFYGASTISSRPKVKLGFLRPFMYFAAVCESDVIRIGSAIVASQGT
jgi:hypothetical protein